MDFNRYQDLARRTQNFDLNRQAMTLHALHGLAAEVGEIHGLYQKVYQGHVFDIGNLIKEIGDALWFISELCDAEDLAMDDVAVMNIDKLKQRYPNGFEVSRSVHRKEGDT